MPAPALALDDLATAWLTRRVCQWDALPGLNHELGSLQLEADPVALKHPCFPPYSAGNEITGYTLFNGRHLATLAPTQIRWRPHLAERRATADGWELFSRTSLLPAQPGAIVELTVRNTAGHARPLDLGFTLSGRARNTGTGGYNWSVPSIPTDMFSFRQEAGLAATVTLARVPGGICITNDTANAHSVQCAWPEPHAWPHPRQPHWHATLAPGATFTVTLLLVWHAERDTTEQVAAHWYGRAEAAFAAARAWWNDLWLAAFTPGNPIFSGHLPTLSGPDPVPLRLYYFGVLTLLTLRRRYPHALVNPAYITLWPRRGEGSVYFSWELPYLSGLLARLDPAALHHELLLAMTAPELEGQMTNLFNGQHWGWGCCAYPHAIAATGLNLARWAGDTTWRAATIRRRPEGKLHDHQPAPDEDPARYPILTGDQAFRDMVTVHRRRHLPGSPLIDYGSRHAYHEVLTHYAHGTAAHTAVQAWALREADPLLGTASAAEADQLIAAVRQLYRPGQGYFDCQFPDGARHPAANLYDLSLVLNTIGEHMPTEMVNEISQFARTHLLTPTWAHCLSPTDPDSVDGLRTDHGWAGCFVAWPPQLALGLLRAGHADPWLAEWLRGVAGITRQGPFAQAYWADDLYPTEAGAAAKVFDDLSGCIHWVIGSGAYFAELVLDGICGLTANPAGQLSLRPGLAPWATSLEVTHIRCHDRSYQLHQGRLTPA
jgi:hypothetical protein